jgi:SAM-dependent methyltransferase
MRGRAGNRPYHWLAEYYDQVFTFHLGWFEAARRRVLGGILPGVESACDLACGTGTTALLLAEKGIRMYGVDLSPRMCRLAREKARCAGLALEVLRGDMRSFRLPAPVDLVICEADALNHVPRKADLVKVACAVARALRPGGYFYFDVNSRLAFEKAWPGTWWMERPGVVAVMRGGYDREGERGWTTAEWFIQEGRRWRRRTERIEEVAWSSREIRDTLRGAGFGQIRAWDAAPFMKSDRSIRPGFRTFYRARKRAMGQ